MAKTSNKKQTSGTVHSVHAPHIVNRRAHFDYAVLEKLEAGIALVGSEVKSVRQGKVQLAGAFAIIRNGRIFLMGCHIETYEQANQFNHDPTRQRPLLLHKREIRRLQQELAKQPGCTLIPLDLFFKRGYAKITLALAKGKAKYDKRQAIKKRDAQRDMQRAVRRR
jgi:SsrA-binding protein